MATLTALKAEIDKLASDMTHLDSVPGHGASSAYQAGAWFACQLSPGGLSQNQALRFGELWASKGLYDQFKTLGSEELWRAALCAQIFKDGWVKSYGLGVGAAPEDSAMQLEYQEEILSALPDASLQWSPRGVMLPLLTEAARGNAVAAEVFRSLMDILKSQPGTTGTQSYLCDSLKAAAI